MIRILDKGIEPDSGIIFVIQKVVHPKGHTIRYQTVPAVRVKHDEVFIQFHDTLAAARQRIGKGDLSAPRKSSR